MTALNWEKDRAKRKAKERSFDDLPPVGSHLDQRRWGTYPPQASVRSHSRHEVTPVHARSRRSDFDQLNRYLRHAMQSDAQRWRACQKAEVIQIMNKLIARCEFWGAGVPVQEKALLAAARDAVKTMSH
jgi:hypothetical protein